MSIQKYKIALVGFGTVARGLIHILTEKRAFLKEEYGCDFQIVAICTASRGNLYRPQGFDLNTLAKLGESRQAFVEDLSDPDTETLIRKCNADIVIELSPTDLETAEPAISYCRAALETGKHVISGNKGPAALAFAELKMLADDQGLAFLNEATVLSGTPVFSYAKAALAGMTITEIKGILNGSTNFILHEMESGSSYDEALEKASQLGYLEADPRGDIDGYDAQAKVAILSNVLLNVPIQLSEVKRAGIASISGDDVTKALTAGERWKLIASLSVEGNKVNAEVKPEKLPMSHPLAQISGTTNALTFTTDLLGEVTISGPGAGSIETGYAVLSDLLIIHKG